MSKVPPRLDESLAIRRAAEDPAEFGPLYEYYFERVYKFAYSRLRLQSQAEDATADIFLAVLKGLRTYRGGNFAAWLFRIAHNKVLNFERREGRRRHDALPEDLTTSSDFTDSVHAKQVVWDLIPQLSPKERQAIALKFAAGLTTSEVAAAMGSNPGAAKMLLLRGLRRLREVAEESGGRDDDSR